MALFWKNGNEIVPYKIAMKMNNERQAERTVDATPTDPVPDVPAAADPPSESKWWSPLKTTTRPAASKPTKSNGIASFM